MSDANNCNTITVNGSAPNCTCLATATISGSADICADQMATVSIELVGNGPWDIIYNGPNGDVPVNGIAASPFTFQTNTAGAYTMISVADVDCMGNVFGQADININESSIGTETHNGCIGDGYSVIVNGEEYNENNPSGLSLIHI